MTSNDTFEGIFFLATPSRIIKGCPKGSPKPPSFYPQNKPFLMLDEPCPRAGKQIWEQECEIRQFRLEILEVSVQPHGLNPDESGVSTTWTAREGKVHPSIHLFTCRAKRGCRPLESGEAHAHLWPTSPRSLRSLWRTWVCWYGEKGRATL